MCFSLRDPRHFSRVFSKDVLNEWVKNESTKWIKSTRIRGLPSPLAFTMLVSKISSTLQICLLWLGFLGCTSGKEHTCQSRNCKRCRFDPWVRKIPWRRAWQHTSVFLPGKPQGQRVLVGCSP